ncbi:hypothetical protein ATANTOWER_010467 [Ataeniobius toweri]|uniref:Uncharacterized protein n=1 Tax=Ataeniobius toweri TaxID=208326 RepID=A0ABU7A636_9TELE|nr:hypothetical protein [Ataeniobius toweri]
MELSLLSKWEWLKFNVRAAAIRIGKQASKLKREKQSQLVNNINNLCGKPDLSPQEQHQLEGFKTQLDNTFLDKARGAFIRSRARWIEEGKRTHHISLMSKDRDRPKRKL